MQTCIRFIRTGTGTPRKSSFVRNFNLYPFSSSFFSERRCRKNVTIYHSDSSPSLFNHIEPSTFLKSCAWTRKQFLTMRLKLMVDIAIF